MSRPDLLQLFRNTVEEVAEKEFPTLEEASVIADLGIDSLSMLEAVGAMEQELSITLPEDDLVGIQTVGQLLQIIERRQAASS